MLMSKRTQQTFDINSIEDLLCPGKQIKFTSLSEGYTYEFFNVIIICERGHLGVQDALL